ncbi:LysR family transcriptional regulator [Vibrio coralliilyticus]|uniref:LysR family transcriptional regulator n=1 Tax=Vibrio coralliilyticus TaxID=190893 RepID=UPI00148DC506|nr:LysR family transcriptional regulator [Vibrio coralliilyticus]NOI31709.1 LysR family transcriptional regulator [Vibrio coralliilyticus]NOI51061.1 LysR family transcriptional regulator [Vibrio coralliilyticus]
MNDVSLEMLQAFVAVVDKKSFSEAARHLGRAQSFVSNKVSQLESSLDIVLFDRSTRYPQLTLQGAALLEEAKAIISHYSALESLSKSQANTGRMQFTLAADIFSELDDKYGLISDFSTKYPDIRLSLKFGVNSDVIDAVLQEKADVGITTGEIIDHPELCSRTLKPNQVCAIAAKNSSLGKLDKVDLSILSKERQILLEPNANTRDRMWQISANFWSSNSSNHALALISRGFGWGVLPKYLVDESSNRDAFKILALPDGSLPKSRVSSLIWRKDGKIDAVLKWAISEITARNGL